MNSAKSKQRLLAALTATAVTIYLVASNAIGVRAARPETVTICHASGQQGTLQYVTLTLPYNAVYGQAGHFSEPGTPNAGHENDYEGPCIESTGTPSPTPTPTGSPTPSPTPTETPTPTPTGTPDPTRTPTPTPEPTRTPGPSNSPRPSSTPTPTPTPQILGMSLAMIGPACGGNGFDVTATLMDNGSPLANYPVTFTYKGIVVPAATDANGVAKVSFAFQGNDGVTVEAEGVDAQVAWAAFPNGCPGGAGGSSSVLGASTGQVLGASTLAATGGIQRVVAGLIYAVGSIFILTGVKRVLLSK